MAKAVTIDDYLAPLPLAQRTVLEKLRKLIRGIVPNAEECLSYGTPTFRLNGKGLISFGAGKDHCALYPMDGTTVAAFAKELHGFSTSKGTIRFQPARPPSGILVKKIVKARVAAVAR
jgi:uncharacterized protein YdhG (YjbR/CyaY superfamily)